MNIALIVILLLSRNTRTGCLLEVTLSSGYCSRGERLQNRLNSNETKGGRLFSGRHFKGTEAILKT